MFKLVSYPFQLFSYIPGTGYASYVPVEKIEINLMAELFELKRKQVILCGLGL